MTAEEAKEIKVTPQEAKTEVPILQVEFAEHLRKYRIKSEMVDTIAENIAEVGSGNVFEDPELLNRHLATWSQWVGATLRKQILDHWFAKKGISVSEEAAKRFALSPVETIKTEKKEEKKKKAVEGEVWVVKVDEKGVPRITMASGDETGITLDEAKKAVVEIRKAYVGEEPLVIYDESAKKHMPNFKSEFVKQNPMLAWTAAKQMDKAMAEGEEFDPIDVFIASQARAEQLKEVLGTKREPEAKGTVGEIISGIKELQEMAKEGKAIDLPSWMTNPVEFIETVQKVTGARGGTADWMTDPAKFVEMVRTIGSEPKGDEGVKTELAELRKSFDAVIEQRHTEERATLQAQIKMLTENQKEMMDYMAELKRPVTGMTEMDILNKIATEGISLARAELPGLRGDLREALRGGGLPAPKTAQEREERKAHYRESLDKDKDIESIGKRLFFPEVG